MIMLRDYQLFSVKYTLTVDIMKADPPCSGEMTKVGQRSSDEVDHVLARSQEKAMAWVEERYRTRAVIVHGVVEALQIDAFLIELTH